MLMRGDFDLNSMQAYTGSLNDVLRKTMLNQEVVFKDQVHELHHLYRTQKTLMQNADWKEYHRYNCSKASAQSTLSNCSNSTRDGPRDLFKGCKSIYDKIQPRPPGLKHPLDPSVRHIDPAELKLSLSIREDNRREGGTKRTWFDVGSHSSSPIEIDLEESSEMTSNEGLEQSPFLSSAAALTDFRGKGGSEASILFDPIITSSVKKNLFFGAAVSNSPLEDSECNPFDQGLNRCSDALSIKELSTRRHQFSSCEPGLLDLNKTQLDDSSCLSNDPTVAHPSTASSLHDFCGLAGKIEEGTVCFATEKKEHNNCSNESSETCHAGHFSFLNFNRKNEKTEYLGRSLKVDGFGISEMDPASLEAAVSRSKLDLCEAFGCNSNDPKNGSDGFILKLLNSQIHSSAGSKQAKSENTKEEDPAISYSDHNRKTDQDGHGNISSSSSKPCCIGDNDSSSVKTTQSEVEFGNSNPFSSDQFSGTHVGSQVSETLMDEQDQRSSDSSEFKHKCVNKEEESAEVDALTREAAEALLGMSLESSSCYQDCAGKVGESNTGENESEKPQYSCDFFELMTLTLTESSVDDYSVSSNPSEVSFTESKDVGLKLRRGRRLKDFQKDILPGLASLSRHEIREDINIMEGVLRSREYKRLQAKMADGHSWCTPVDLMEISPNSCSSQTSTYDWAPRPFLVKQFYNTLQRDQAIANCDQRSVALPSLIMGLNQFSQNPSSTSLISMAGNRINKQIVRHSTSGLLTFRDGTSMFSSKRKSCGVKSEDAGTICLASTGGCHCSKRRKLRIKRRIRVPAVSNKLANIPPDDYSWRKYGQKPIKGSPYPRSYYKCSSVRGCPARKHVERCLEDSTMLVVTYEGGHQHSNFTFQAPALMN